MRQYIRNTTNKDCLASALNTGESNVNKNVPQPYFYDCGTQDWGWEFATLSFPSADIWRSLAVSSPTLFSAANWSLLDLAAGSLGLAPEILSKVSRLMADLSAGQFPFRLGLTVPASSSLLFSLGRPRMRC